jgi:hypothetical protein
MARVMSGQRKLIVNGQVSGELLCELVHRGVAQGSVNNSLWCLTLLRPSIVFQRLFSRLSHRICSL